jgi:hypothetical protein
VGCSWEAALADDEGEVVRLLEALNGVDPAGISGWSANNDEANWVSRALRWGADMGLSPDISALILSERLNEIRAASSPRSNAKRPKRGQARRRRLELSGFRAKRGEKGQPS